jgi:redox-sensitive bicupin YhaK (pirin superfamily)
MPEPIRFDPTPVEAVRVQAVPVQRSRGVEHVIRAQPVTDGAGVRLFRNFDAQLQQRLDPFLMLDEFRSDDADDYIAGFPEHPHRGFETVTYMLAGTMRHQDSAGNSGLLRSGGVQWMKAARGVLHSEMPEQEQGLMHGFQLWLNLPAAEKMDPPGYDDIPAERIVAFALASGVQGKVIAGQSHGVRGPAPARATEPLYVDLALPAGTQLTLPIPQGHNSFAYVYEGEAELGPAQAVQTVAVRQLAVLGNEREADGIRIAAGQRSARLLVLAGKPLHETIVQHGPFVMNTRREIMEAFEDYQAGRLGR